MYRMNQMIGSWKIGIVLFLFTFLVIGASSAHATYIWWGAVTPDPTGATDPWTIATLIVGNEADGSLSIEDGQQINTTSYVWVGRNTLHPGAPLVDGWLAVYGEPTPGDYSTLTVGQDFIVGAMMDPNQGGAWAC